jgi:hypothetical protein
VRPSRENSGPGPLPSPGEYVLPRLVGVVVVPVVGADECAEEGDLAPPAVTAVGRTATPSGIEGMVCAGECSTVLLCCAPDVSKYEWCGDEETA